MEADAFKRSNEESGTRFAAEGQDWSREEVQLTVADYFSMLHAELLGQPYSKAEHRRRLRPLLHGRSEGSVEFKHQNISAVLVHLGFPYISGYKPRGNYQRLLMDAVEQHLAGQNPLPEDIRTSPVLNPSQLPLLPIGAVDQLIEPPPERIDLPKGCDEPWLSRRGRRIDYARREAENRQLGGLGEQFVLELEKRRLLHHRRDDLAGRIDWVASTRGDGIGFDVLSFNETDDSERLIEVKTTALGKFFPFYVTSTEVKCSEAMAKQYHLYRVFEFSKAPRLYMLQGALSANCRLDPVQYRAAI